MAAADGAARPVSSLSRRARRERDGVRGYSLSLAGNSLTPTLSPNGERERTSSPYPQYIRKQNGRSVGRSGRKLVYAAASVHQFGDLAVL
jgi:hypothetical protein